MTQTRCEMNSAVRPKHSAARQPPPNAQNTRVRCPKHIPTQQGRPASRQEPDQQGDDLLRRLRPRSRSGNTRRSIDLPSAYRGSGAPPICSATGTSSPSIESAILRIARLVRHPVEVDRTFLDGVEKVEILFGDGAIDGVSLVGQSWTMILRRGEILPRACAMSRKGQDLARDHADELMRMFVPNQVPFLNAVVQIWIRYLQNEPGPVREARVTSRRWRLASSAGCLRSSASRLLRTAASCAPSPAATLAC